MAVWLLLSCVTGHSNRPVWFPVIVYVIVLFSFDLWLMFAISDSMVSLGFVSLAARLRVQWTLF